MSKSISLTDKTYAILKAARDGCAKDTGKSVTFDAVILCLINEVKNAPV